jgi:hypothetical protein
VVLDRADDNSHSDGNRHEGEEAADDGFQLLVRQFARLGIQFLADHFNFSCCHGTTIRAITRRTQRDVKAFIRRVIYVTHTVIKKSPAQLSLFDFDFFEMKEAAN